MTNDEWCGVRSSPILSHLRQDGEEERGTWSVKRGNWVRLVISGGVRWERGGRKKIGEGGFRRKSFCRREMRFLGLEKAPPNRPLFDPKAPPNRPRSAPISTPSLLWF